MFTPQAGGNCAYAHYTITERSCLADDVSDFLFVCAGKWKLFVECSLEEILFASHIKLYSLVVASLY
jgi:hypothetical protein